MHQKNKTKYYLSSFFYNFGRTIPHAILALIILDKGLTLSNIALLQIPFMLAVFLFEVPSGMLSDRYSRKFVYLLSSILLFFAYFIIYTQDSLGLLMLAWFIYGLSTATNTGSIDADIILTIDDERQQKEFHTIREKILFGSAASAAIVGAFLYPYIGFHIYLISLLSILSGLIIIFSYEKPKLTEQLAEEKHSLKKISQMKFPKTFFIPLLGILILMIFIQTFYQYWQPLYHYKEINIKFFGLLYIVMQLMGFFGAHLYNKLKVKSITLSLSIILLSTVLLSLRYTGIPFIILFMIGICAMYYYNTHLFYKMKTGTDQVNISVSFSLASVIINLFTIIIMLEMILILNSFSIISLYAINILLTISLSLIYIITNKKLLLT